MDVLITNWPLALIAVVLALVLFYFLLRPRQRVTLTDSAPLRPHMTRKDDGRANRGIAGAAATVTGSIIHVRGYDLVPVASGAHDDLVQLKGVGPKLATLLNQRGITRFDQIAKLSAAQVNDLDDSLGAFRGRLARDLVVAQADYLARGDIDGFEQRFGKL